jgi:ribosome-binding factor A
MAIKKASRKILRSLCAEVAPDDGIDPRSLAKHYRQRKPAHQTRRLCSQVADTLGDLLAGQAGDDVLQSLHVVSVDPAPDASRLLVTVGAPTGEGLDPFEVIEHLERASPRLRHDVAAAITRKRAPTLVYRFAVPIGSMRRDG